MILKLSSIILLLTLNSYAITVLVTNSALKYEELIDKGKLKVLNVSSLKKACIPLKINEIKTNKYVTAHYINKGSILCRRNVKEYKDNGVVFNFGSIQIEKKGKILQDNDKFIRIRKPNGRVEKIYKDGQER